MVEPDDYGFGPRETLARVADPSPGRKHSAFWNLWWDTLLPVPPALRPRDEADPSDPSCTHEFDSVGRGSAERVRIGCRLLNPQQGAARGLVIVTHGYAAEGAVAERDSDWGEIRRRGCAVLLMRVRGYAGSRLDTGDLTTPADDQTDGVGWITRGLDAAAGDRPEFAATMDWVLPQAVADVAQAIRAAHDWARTHAPSAKIMLHGESFGGGLAVIAAGQLTGRTELPKPLARLALGVPTFGDWPWRTAHRSAGSGGEIAELLRRRTDFEDEIIARLRLLDAVVHARRVLVPTLAKLALRDEVVPAPAAAAVYNALGCSPGEKWRFITPYGHFDGGLAHLRREVLFQRLLEDWFDPAQPVVQSMARWEPVLSQGERVPA